MITLKMLPLYSMKIIQLKNICVKIWYITNDDKSIGSLCVLALCLLNHSQDTSVY